MARSNGVIRIARKLYDGSDPIFGGDEFSRRDAWVWMIYAASFRDGYTRTIDGTDVTLDRGELIASQTYLAQRFGWHQSKVRRFIATLERHRRIEVGRTVRGAGTVYRLPSYDEWQPQADTPTETPTDTPTDTPEARRYRHGEHEADTPSDTSPDTPTDTIKKVGIEEEGEEEVTDTDTSLRSVSADESEALYELADVGPDDEGRATRALVAAWMELQVERPEEPEIRKQGAVAKRLAAKHTPRRLAVALYGIVQLYPYSEGAPWDLFDLERKFSKACQAALTPDRGQQEKARLADEIERRRRR